MSEVRDPHELRVHPLAEAVPAMRREEWLAFVADVRERGILEPLRLASDGTVVLDGRHRLRAALELELSTAPVEPADLVGLSELEYIIRAAVLRRHLTDDQRAILGARLREHLPPSSSGASSNTPSG